MPGRFDRRDSSGIRERSEATDLERLEEAFGIDWSFAADGGSVFHVSSATSDHTSISY
jgi:hypothetical protein